MNPNTPTDGHAASPALHQALANMGVQLENFAGEVRELKALVRQMGGAPRGGDSTLDIDVEGFKRTRRQRAALLCAAAMVPVVMLVAVWGLWPTTPRKPISSAGPTRSAALMGTTSRAPAPVTAPVTAPAPTAPIAAPTPSAPDRPMSPSTASRPQAPRHAIPRTPPPAVSPSPSEPFRRPPPPLTAHETSGGAPILD